MCLFRTVFSRTTLVSNTEHWHHFELIQLYQFCWRAQTAKRYGTKIPSLLPDYSVHIVSTSGQTPRTSFILNVPPVLVRQMLVLHCDWQISAGLNGKCSISAKTCISKMWILWSFLQQLTWQCKSLFISHFLGFLWCDVKYSVYFIWILVGVTYSLWQKYVNLLLTFCCNVQYLSASKNSTYLFAFNLGAEQAEPTVFD